MNIKNKILIISLLFTLVLTSCDLDVNNPNSPTGDDLKTYDGLALTAVGLQKRMASSIGSYITVSGAVAGESSPVIGYLDYQSLRKYPDRTKITFLDKQNSYVRIVWREQYGIVKSANAILDNVYSVGMDPKAKNGLIALAKLGKASALYTIMTHWEKLPVHIKSENPKFTDRAGAIEECLTLLEDAEELSKDISEDFLSSVVSSKLDIYNTVKAYQARINLLKGDYAKAANAAAEVSNESEYVYNLSVGINPLYDHFVKSDFTEALASWVEGAEENDARVAATIDLNTRKGYFGNDTCYVINKYPAADSPFKLYTLNEMTLIKAEAYARGGNGDAVAEINKVRAEAGLPSFSGTNILEEIFKQRYYELFMTGQHFEDLRRFKNDNISFVNELRERELSHEWLTYPDWEVDTNPNTPAQPTDINYGFIAN